MTSVYTIHDVSGQVAWVDEEYLNHPVFGAHLIEVPYGTKPYLAAMYSGNPEKLREKLAKDQEKAEAEAKAADAVPEKHGLADAVQIEQNVEAGAVPPTLIPAEENLPEFDGPVEPEEDAKAPTKKDAE